MKWPSGVSGCTPHHSDRSWRPLFRLGVRAWLSYPGTWRTRVNLKTRSVLSMTVGEKVWPRSWDEGRRRSGGHLSH